MTEPINFFIKGEVRTQSIEEIKGLAIEIFSNRLANLETNDFEIAESNIFPEKFIYINRKNIEFCENFYLTDYIMTKEINKGLATICCADVLFSVTVFRIGSYSYYAVSGRMLKPDQKEILLEEITK